MKKHTLSLLILFLLFNFAFSQEKFNLAAVEKFQNELNTEYANPKTSPLMEEDM